MKIKRSKSIKFRPVRLTFWVVVPILFFVFLIFSSGDNLLTWISARREIAAQQKQIKRYKEEIEMMEHQIDLLNNDLESLERFAREKFHFAEPGEDVYIIKE